MSRVYSRLVAIQTFEIHLSIARSFARSFSYWLYSFAKLQFHCIGVKFYGLSTFIRRN